jgi:hypothetical protein
MTQARRAQQLAIETEYVRKQTATERDRRPSPGWGKALSGLPDSLAGIAPTTLSERLRTLEENGVVERRFYSMSPPRAEYVLTAKGRDLGPIVGSMRNWGRAMSASDPKRPLAPLMTVLIRWT